MSTVGPTIRPPVPVAPQAAPEARRAAQAAFFQAALGATPAPAPSRPKIPDPDAAPPERILRPGSLLDIKV